MKKVCLLLLAIIFLTYGYKAYQVVDAYLNDVLKIKVSGNLSEITEKVIPVPLQIPDSGVVRDVKRVRQDGNNLFMISDNRLLHFNLQGKFINQIARDINEENGKFIVEYVLNTHKKQALVIDSERNISTFDYHGNLISSIRIDKPWHKLTALIYHDGFLWATAETLVKNKDNHDSYLIEHKLYQLDMDVNEISSHALRSSCVGMDRMFSSLLVDELLVDEQGVYAYSTIFDTAILLQDTLYIAQQKKIPLPNKNTQYCIYPIRKGQRYYLSTYYDSITDTGHTFCYDDTKLTAYMLSDGFRDDFFMTGCVSDFQPMDIYNESYCFLKSGKQLAKMFPERAKNDDAPVLFILKLKA